MNTQFLPGAIIETPYSENKYLVVSSPMRIAALNNAVKAVPIIEEKSNDCYQKRHLPMSSNLKTNGLICLHKPKWLNCDNLNRIEQIEDQLLTYVLSITEKLLPISFDKKGSK
ncbi:hypothetical protein [Lactobacillus agrestimuris]|uniref:hypothetical protein n=1 Tax=Lactobacillus agrestimuris TaxID=2941328 RepID=UPI0020441DDD|nr:hypothetical protein [Lactobacillus agrestimuris]